MAWRSQQFLVQILMEPESNSRVSTGTHSLHYHYLTLSEPGSALPDFLAVGYVDDQPFIQYDSRLGRAKPQALWVAPVEAQYWETETQKQRGWEKVQQVEIWTMMRYHNRSSGLHSIQRSFGCEIQEDGSTSIFWQFGFDGQDHLSLDLETLSWVSAEPAAIQTKPWLERERCYAEYDKAYLEGLCLTSLHRYLQLGGQNLTRQEPPKVQVTKHLAQDGCAILRCWALGFYPKDITLSWWLGGEELTLETEQVETRPSGDGTYQTWVAVHVCKGVAETQYTCHVQHPSLNSTLTVAWEPSSCCGPKDVIIITSFFVALLVAGILFWKTWLRAKNKTSYKQAPGGEDLHKSQGPVTEGAAQHIC
ncbi:H-2 class I histocompatibility antigen, Q10 alpha chain-like isoform X2 [Choloepus didactylus]|uniref:H-2 class I histocompatibility antigen, Q10 alpha chain-like isoform X2 n=1 Tax=Choloepus didactylus TaxID=27675 RepID=UPI0018A067C5|nr:H-2 class I histocompatibility antigen, Q10 alpha chain-like isoform X2 [Choloepus didactylus]